MAVSQILVEAFPALYRSTFGRLEPYIVVRLLTALYRAGCLSLEATRVAERSGAVVGLAILHVGNPIGRGTIADYWQTLHRELPLGSRGRAFIGGLIANVVLSRRIPHAPDLVYIEALAVAADERSRGVGSLLLQDAEDWARQHRRNRLALHVLSSNYGARRLYERTGFRPWPTTPSFLGRFWGSASHHRNRWAAVLMLRHLEIRS